MSDFKHWKNYAPIERVAMFDDAGAGPEFARLQVTANLHPSEAYPETRITIHLGGLASCALTVEQSAELRATLEAAERDVARGSDLAAEEHDDGG